MRKGEAFVEGVKWGWDEDLGADFLWDFEGF